MDGVLANFIGGYKIKFGEDFIANESQAWENIDKHPELWYELPPFEGAIDFFNKLKYCADKVMLLTSLPHTPDTAFIPGALFKRQWVKKYLGDQYMIPCIGGHRKSAYMNNPGDILIDDMYEKNCVPWMQAGGRAIHHVEGSDHNETYRLLMDTIYS